MHPKLLTVMALPILASCNQIPLSGNSLSDPTCHLPTLADLLTIESSASIFYSYARELELSGIFAEQDTGDNGNGITLLVPNNKAVMALARKPHEDLRMKEQDVKITQEQFEDISRENVERWIQAHIIPRTSLRLENNQYPTMLESKNVSFSTLSSAELSLPEWKRVCMDEGGGAKILDMKQASNGVLYLLDGTVLI